MAIQDCNVVSQCAHVGRAATWASELVLEPQDVYQKGVICTLDGQPKRVDVMERTIIGNSGLQRGDSECTCWTDYPNEWIIQLVGIQSDMTERTIDGDPGLPGGESICTRWTGYLNEWIVKTGAWGRRRFVHHDYPQLTHRTFHHVRFCHHGLSNLRRSCPFVRRSPMSPVVYKRSQDAHP